MKIYTQDTKPVLDIEDTGNNLQFSKDVIVWFPEDGLLNIGYYDYELEYWAFHSNTMVKTPKTFYWCYAPKELVSKTK